MADVCLALGFLQTLEELTDVTRNCLHTKETFVPWSVAQRIDPKQKVKTSIEYVPLLSLSRRIKEHVLFLVAFSKLLDLSAEYWKDMARSTVFKGHVLKDCVWRIHLDIVKVWNFRDPQGLLMGQEFHAQMLKLIEPFVPQYHSEL
ncbi:hypothetical protein C0992_005182 [Termitomyces sp. T32_za158]|nr:hypothetical protein C0992_005182 [Termitomyces sp. T32_za158]